MLVPKQWLLCMCDLDLGKSTWMSDFENRKHQENEHLEHLPYNLWYNDKLYQYSTGESTISWGGGHHMEFLDNLVGLHDQNEMFIIRQTFEDDGVRVGGHRARSLWLR